MADLPRRRLGRTGLEVSELGYGAWGIGGGLWGEVDDRESVRALELALDRGVNFIDTALTYGPHHSERVVGRVVRSRSSTVYVATKVPPKNLRWPAAVGTLLAEVFPGAHVRHCVERSLRNLGTDRIDLLQLHVWRDEWLGQGDWQETIEALQAEGKIRFFGISTNDHEPGNAVKAAASGFIDTVQTIYNVFEQAPEAELFSVCRANDVAVIARAPFDEGALTGRLSEDTTFAADDFRARYFGGDRMHQVLARVRAIAAALELPEHDLAEVALRFVLSHPTVSTAIAGMRSARNVERNLVAASAGSLSPKQLRALGSHRWAKNFYTFDGQPARA